MQTVKCERCKQLFEARVADRKRGWGRFCSKSCKAKEQESRTGQYKSFNEQNEYKNYEHPQDDYEYWCRK